MYTFCPECSTVFTVNAEHLHAANGLVRCGECSQVFSAVDHLYDDLAGARYAIGGTVSLQPDADQTADSSRLTADDALSGDDVAVAGNDVLATSLTRPVFGSAWAGRPVSLRDVASAAGIGLLLLLLGMQWAYINRDELAMSSKWRPVMEHICSLLACKLPLPLQLDRIALLKRDVRKHPQVDDALLVNATLINRADFTQSYPVLDITFSDLSGKPVAERRFLPAEYLGESVNRAAGMAPASPVPVVLEIEDPGESAVSFQFRFL